MKTLRELYLQGRKQLAEREPSDALLLCEAYLGADRKRIALFGEACPPLEKQQAYLSALTRRAAGEPLQYILGFAWFDGMKLAVREGVLIPREDTLTLVELAAEQLGDRPLAGMDLCAGTGAVALALEKRCPGCRITAAELYPVPLSVLAENIAAYSQGRVDFRPLDVLGSPPALGEKLDFLVSNPPYISREEIPTLQEEVRREPVSALDGGADGLLFYRHIISRWGDQLKPGGLLAFEIGETQGEAVAALLAEAGFTRIQLRQDLNGLDRAISGLRGAQEE